MARKKKVIEKILSTEEMLKSDLLTKDIRLKELELLSIQQKKKILDLEFDKELKNKHNEYTTICSKKEIYIEELKDKYKVESSNFSYDPITGDIKDE